MDHSAIRAELKQIYTKDPKASVPESKGGATHCVSLYGVVYIIELSFSLIIVELPQHLFLFFLLTYNEHRYYM